MLFLFAISACEKDELIHSKIESVRYDNDIDNDTIIKRKEKKIRRKINRKVRKNVKNIKRINKNILEIKKHLTEIKKKTNN